MKICLFGISGVPLGKHNVKDTRLDKADELVEAKKKIYVQVDFVGEDEIGDAEAILTSETGKPDLILHDLEFIEMRLSREPSATELVVLNKTKAQLEKEDFLFKLDLNADEKLQIASYGLYTLKPVVVAPQEAIETIDEFLPKVLEASNNISFLTVGGKENRAWLIRKGVTAWEAAGTIHSDIQKGFIRAEIISYEDFINAGGETQAKRANKMRLETKEYVMQDYDLVNFRFNK